MKECVRVSEKLIIHGDVISVNHTFTFVFMVIPQWRYRWTSSVHWNKVLHPIIGAGHQNAVAFLVSQAAGPFNLVLICQRKKEMLF